MRLRAPAAFVLLALLAAAPARGEVSTLILIEGGTLPGGPPGHTITSLNNTGVDHSTGYAVTVNTTDGVATLSHVWGGDYPAAGGVLRTEQTVGQYEQTSFESFFGISDALESAYSPICTDTVSGLTGLDAVFLDGTKAMIERDPYPHMTGWYWSFGSRPAVTAGGVPYFVGGITNTPGGASQNRGLFYGFGATPLLIGGDPVIGLPDTLTHTAFDFDYRLSGSGNHYIVSGQTVTGSTLDDEHIVIDGAVALAGGLPVSENGSVPASAGGLPGELWDNFDFMGVTNDGRWMFTGDTNANALYDEFVAIDGEIAYREGDTLDAEVLSGAIEGAYMNDDGDVAYIWDIQGGVLEALYLNDQLLVREGDPVDVTGDGIADGGTALTDFTGISSLTLSDRDPVDGSVRLYFVADFDQAPTAIAGALPEPEDALPAARAEVLGLSGDEVDSREKRAGDGTFVVLEGFFVVVAFPVETGVAAPAADGSLPVSAPLLSVSPNPFRPGEARIRFAPPSAGPVAIDVYDIAGRHVRSLVAPGTLSGAAITWDGRDGAGRDAAPGVYFVRAASGDKIEKVRVTLVR